MEKLSELWLNYRRWILIGAGIVAVLILMLIGMSHPHSAGINTPDTFSSSTSHQQVHHQTSSFIYVDVKGAVDHPGVIRVARDARVEEALKVVKPAADADLKQVNLAKQLTDQQVLYIPKIGEQVTTTSSDNSTGVANDESNGGDQRKINVNTAGKNQLCEITGIGDKKADLIIQYRQEHGQFKSVDDLKNISGFGEKTVAKIKSQLAV